MMNNTLPTTPTLGGLQLRWRHRPLSASRPLAAWQGLLSGRKLCESDPFFTPRLSNLPDPELMVDMAVAADRLVQAIQQDEHIHIFGDFDADGVNGTAILTEALRAAGSNVTSSIPHRADDGHGIGVEAVREAVANGCSLGISVDTGTVCFDACTEAQNLGLQMIITDHHLPAAELPHALAVLNPARKDCGFAEGLLCGTGVAFFLLMAVWKRLKLLGPVHYDLRQLLDRVAVATVADVMEIRGVNRVLVSHGLKQLGSRPSPGMDALLRLAKLGKRPVSTEQISFYLAPRINAAGRMSHGNDALKLLLATDSDAAMPFAEVLDTCNQQRRKVELEVFKQAEEKLTDQKVLASYDHTWHAGVVGLVAGRLARKHGYPAAIGFVAPENNIRVSLRGQPGFHVGNLLQTCAPFMLGFGGHAGAGGGTVPLDRWDGFKKCFADAIDEQQKRDALQRTLEIDGVLHLSALHHGLADRLQRFEPIGRGNPACLWLLSDVQIESRRELKGGVLRLRLHQQGHQVDAIVFGSSKFLGFLEQGSVVSVIGSLEKDNWRGGDAIQFIIEDVLAPS